MIVTSSLSLRLETLVSPIEDRDDVGVVRRVLADHVDDPLHGPAAAPDDVPPVAHAHAELELVRDDHERESRTDELVVQALDTCRAVAVEGELGQEDVPLVGAAVVLGEAEVAGELHGALRGAGDAHDLLAVAAREGHALRAGVPAQRVGADAERLAQKSGVQFDAGEEDVGQVILGHEQLGNEGDFERGGRFAHKCRKRTGIRLICKQKRHLGGICL